MSNLIPSERVNGYFLGDLDVHGMGDWDGDEELAAEQFRRLEQLIADTLPNGDDDAAGYDAQRTFERISHEAWDAWGSDSALLTATDADFRVWIRAHV